MRAEYQGTCYWRWIIVNCVTSTLIIRGINVLVYVANLVPCNPSQPNLLLMSNVKRANIRIIVIFSWNASFYTDALK